MKIIIGAIALALSVPALAQTTSDEHKMDCCEKKQPDGKECCCCKDMAKKDHEQHKDHQPKADGDKAHQGHDGHAH